MTVRSAPVDLEALTVAHLLRDDDLHELVATRISSELADDLGKAGTLPALRLWKLPGSYVDTETAWLEAGRLQFDAWGATKADAFDVAQAAVRATLEAQDVAHTLGVITKVTVDATPYYSEDPETDLPRYIFTATMHAHPLSATDR